MHIHWYAGDNYDISTWYQSLLDRLLAQVVCKVMQLCTRKIEDRTVGLTPFFVWFHKTCMSEIPLGTWYLGITTFYLPFASSIYPLFINLIRFCLSNWRIDSSFIRGEWNFRHGVGYPKWNTRHPSLAYFSRLMAISIKRANFLEANPTMLIHMLSQHNHVWHCD